MMMAIGTCLAPRRLGSLVIALLCCAFVAPAARATSRRADLVLNAAVADLPTDAGPITVWIPVPSTTRDQEITNLTVEGDDRWEFAHDPVYGNRYIHTTIEHPRDHVEAVIHFRVERKTVLFDRLSPKEVAQEELRRFLLADTHVTLSPRVRSIADRVTRNTKGVLEEARALYDWVAANVTLDRTKPGWGSGDTERALDVKSGDCTDFQSLFISLARARGIPARFVIGFAIPTSADENVTRYECWAEFYLQARGWVPVDPSEASSTHDPGVQNFLFGNLEFDRIEFSRGRDITLDPPTAAPLNYFIFPYAEADGVSVGTPSVSLRIATEPAKGRRKR